MNIVSLSDMLDAREKRFQQQQALLKAYKKPLICLTFNIPGPVKVLPGIPAAFQTACRQIEASLKEKAIPVIHTEYLREKTGYEAFYSINAEPESVKRLMIALEDRDRLGRLLDIDVLRPDGTKISREELKLPVRRCLLCDAPAHVCSRSRAHSVAELTAEITAILKETIT